MCQPFDADEAIVNVRIQSRRKVALLSSVAFIGIFVLPWVLPVHQEPNVSVSYAFGFNNFAAWLSVAVLLLCITISKCRTRRTHGPCPNEAILMALLVHSDAGNEKRISPWILAVATILAIGAVGIWYRLVPIAWFGEMGYFVPRLQMMATGARPYTDFQFTYGPAMLYPSRWIWQLFPNSVSIEGAYASALIIHWVAGTWLLVYLINRLGDNVSKNSLFWCAFLPMLATDPWGLGLNYTPLRFVVAPAFLFMMNHWLSGKKMNRPGATWQVMIAPILGFLFPIAALSISPEMGLALVIALLAYFLLLLWARPILAVTCIVAAIASIPVGRWAFGKSYFAGLLSAGNGSLSLPVYPTPQVLLFILAATWILPLLALIVLFRDRTNLHLSALAGGLLVLLGLLIPVALGRCDIGHVYLNGLGIFVLFLALAKAAYPTKGSFVRIVFLLIFGLVGIMGFWGQYRPWVDNVIRVNIGESALPIGHDSRSIWAKSYDDILLFCRMGKAMLHFGIGHKTTDGEIPYNNADSMSISSLLARGKPLDYGPDLRQLLKYKKIGTPLGGSEEVDRFLKVSGRQIPEYYCQPLSGINSGKDIARKLRDISLMDTILVPAADLADPIIINNEPSLRQQTSRSLSLLLIFPAILPKERNPVFSVAEILRREINEKFVRIGVFRDSLIIIMQRK